MSLWYLSFASDDHGFLGATVVEADDAEAAVGRATRIGLNPGGEVAIVPVPQEAEPEARKLLNRLASEAELRGEHGGKKVKEMSEEERAEFGLTTVVCESCNEED
jgi:hypothetical protein